MVPILPREKFLTTTTDIQGCAIDSCATNSCDILVNGGGMVGLGLALALAGEGFSVVVLDAQTGDILALANYPSYSPDKRGNLTGEQLRNRALTDSFEPGSTMKPFVIALAMEKGMVKPETPIDTSPGKLYMNGKTITDAHPHGMLSVSEVIQKSSNVGTVKIAMKMTPKDMWEMYTQVGFG